MIHLLTLSFKDEHGKRFYSEEDLFKLEKILISHYNYLQEQLSKLQTSTANTTSLINMIDLEQDVSWEHVSKFVQLSQNEPQKWINYFKDDEKIFLQNTIPSLSHNDESTHQYILLLTKIESYLKQGIQAESPEGIQIAIRQTELSDTTFQGDDNLIEQFWEVRKLPVQETGLYPISKEVLEFVERCIDYAASKN